jgi:hypothetical protein
LRRERRQSPRSEADAGHAKVKTEMLTKSRQTISKLSPVATLKFAEK